MQICMRPLSYFPLSSSLFLFAPHSLFLRALGPYDDRVLTGISTATKNSPDVYFNHWLIGIKEKKVHLAPNALMLPHHSHTLCSLPQLVSWTSLPPRNSEPGRFGS